MNELIITKTKTGYKASDRNGNYVTASSKELAKQKWYATFGVDREPKQYGFNMNTLDIKLF